MKRILIADFDWVKIQAEYDTGVAIQELCKSLKMSPKTINKAVKMGLFKSRTQSESSVFKHRRYPRDYSKNRENRSALANYRGDCSFRFNLADYPEEFDFDLIVKHGWYRAKNHGDNPNGVSRDHMVSVRYGFDHGVDPKIISHPANCRLMQHRANVSKLMKCSITLQELNQRISDWNLKYGLTVWDGKDTCNVMLGVQLPIGPPEFRVVI